MSALAEQVTDFEQRVGRPLIGPARFSELIGEALDERRGFAAGKVGDAERRILQYPIVLERVSDRKVLWAYEKLLAHQQLGGQGLFPPQAAFYRRWAGPFAEAVRRLDCLGLALHTLEANREIVEHHRIEARPMYYPDQEPTRTVPNDESRCWLPRLRGRRVLLVSAFASVLAARANRETFEAVWAHNGKPWFEPASVEALDVPYGYLPSTWERYPTSFEVLDDVTARIAEREFDVAIVGAGALGIPIAACVKGMGRVGISLGGPIQPLFGVRGARWLADPEWRVFVNDTWADLPPEYRPDPAYTYENYW